MVKLPTLKCERCGWEWIPRQEALPKTCPKCKSAWWDVPRKVKEEGK